MGNMWYYQQGSQRMGPIPAEALKALAAAGQIQPSDPIMRDDMTTWVPANQVRGLFADAASTVPAPAPLPTSEFSAPAAMEDMSIQPAPYPAARASFTSAQKTRRILLIVAAAIIFVCYFTPEFYTSVSRTRAATPRFGMDFNPTPGAEQSETYFIFGWESWWGMVSFFVSIAALGGAITDLATASLAIMRTILKWVHLATFGIITLVSLVGTILGVFGIGLKVYGVSLAAAKHAGYTVYGIPITAALLVGAAVMGVIVALHIVVKDKA